MLKTMLKVAVIGSLLSGCSLCCDQYVFIDKNFVPIDKKHPKELAQFKAAKKACLEFVQDQHPGTSTGGYGGDSPSLSPSVGDTEQKEKVLETMKDCMKDHDYVLMQITGRSSG